MGSAALNALIKSVVSVFVDMDRPVSKPRQTPIDMCLNPRYPDFQSKQARIRELFGSESEYESESDSESDDEED